MKTGESGLKDRIIDVENVTKSYGNVDAVKEISLSIKKGELFGLIGPNGAGKTTLFRLLLGLIRPTSGRIRVKGVDVSEIWSREVRAHTGYLPENIVFYDHLSGFETLLFFAKIKGAPHEEVTRLLGVVGLAEAAQRKVGEYSKGMRQRLGLAQALLAEPDILFLDEPTTGLDPEGIGVFYDILNDVKAKGVTIVLTSHILKEIQDKVDRLGIVGGGRLLAAGTVRELRSALGLKPTIRVSCRGDNKPLREAASEAGGEILFYNDDMVTIKCRPEEKMGLLKAVMCNEAIVKDVELIEPSLEDVFMKYAGAGER